MSRVSGTEGVPTLTFLNIIINTLFLTLILKQVQ